MFASAIHRFLSEGADDASMRTHLATFEGAWVDSPERQRVLDAGLAGDQTALAQALEALHARATPEATLLKQIASSSRIGRQLDVVHAVERWAADQLAGRTDSSRAKTRELNAELRTSLTRVLVAMDGRQIDIVAHRRPSNTGRTEEHRIAARFDRRDVQRYLPLACRSKPLHRIWDDAEILASLQDWAATNSRSPKCTDWTRAGWDRPGALTIRRHFRGWRKALRRAGLKPDGREYDLTAPRCHKHWSIPAALRALQDATRAAGRPPRGSVPPPATRAPPPSVSASAAGKLRLRRQAWTPADTRRAIQTMPPEGTQRAHPIAHDHSTGPASAQPAESPNPARA